MSKVLDIAKFNLEAWKTVAELRIELMKAYAEYNYRMMETLEKQVKVETDQLNLVKLRNAFRDFKKARDAAEREVNRLDKEAGRWQTSIQRAANLALGELLEADRVALSWNAFYFLLNRASFETIGELNRVKVSAEDRLGANFARARNPNADCEDAPATIHLATALMEWARKRNYVPRIGSSAQMQLATLMTALNAHAAATAESLRTELAAAISELQRIREMAWKTINIQNEQPKTPAKK